jgi:hypothetical protein
MVIRILCVRSESANGCRARIQHGKESLDAEVALSPAAAADQIGRPLTVEIGFESLVSWSLLPELLLPKIVAPRGDFSGSRESAGSALISFAREARAGRWGVVHGPRPLAPRGDLEIVGRVRRRVEAGGDLQIYDVCFDEDSQCVGVSSEELGGAKLDVGALIRLVLAGVCFYPTNA